MPFRSCSSLPVLSGLESASSGLSSWQRFVHNSFARFELSAAASSGVCSYEGFAHSSCLRFRHWPGPSKASNPPLQLPVACPALRAWDCRLPPPMLRTLHCSLQWPFQLSGLFLPFRHWPGPLKSLKPSAAASSRLSSSQGLRLPPPPPMLRTLRCSLQWPFQLSGLCTQLSYGSETAAWPFKSLERSAAAYSGLFSCQGFARSSFLRFWDCRLAPSKASNAPLQLTVAFSAVRALHAALSYGSETAAWPLQKPRTLRCSLQWPFQLSGLCTQLSYGSETAAWPLQKPRTLRCSLQWPFQLLSGLCTQLFLTVLRLPPGPFKSLERSAAAYSGLFSCQGFARILRFWDCRLAPSKASNARNPSTQMVFLLHDVLKAPNITKKNMAVADH